MMCCAREKYIYTNKHTIFDVYTESPYSYSIECFNTKKGGQGLAIKVGTCRFPTHNSETCRATNTEWSVFLEKDGMLQL